MKLLTELDSLDNVKDGETRILPTKVSQLQNDSGYTTNTGTITGVSVNSTSVATSGVANITSMPASILSGAIPSDVTATTQSQSDNSTKLATTGYVRNAISALPAPINNLKDGSATGSLRTVGSRTEDSSYTIGEHAFSAGVGTRASGKYSVAFGYQAKASNLGAFSAGYNTEASGQYSHAEGIYTIAGGNESHAEGYYTEATNTGSHAEGQYTIASSSSSHAEGYYTIAKGGHTEGDSTFALFGGCHAEGTTDNTNISGTITAIDEENLKVTVSGFSSSNNLIYQLYNHNGTTFYGDQYITNAQWNSNQYILTLSKWDSSLAVNGTLYVKFRTMSTDVGAHAEGAGTKAASRASHAEGIGTITNSYGQHVEGKWNVVNSNYLHIAGNGTADNARSNAYTLDWNGNGVYAGKLTVGTGPSSNMDVATKKYVDDSILALPEPMIFKGSLGTGGTITSLPTASASNEGYTYKVITAGTYASQSAKVGDTFISDGSTWVLIPSGDEPSGTVTSIKIEATSPIAVNDSSAITTSGTRTISHANSGVTAGTYRSVTVNATGHVTAGTNPTTLSGYGITDAKIANGVITLGSNTITPLTSHQDISGKLDKSGGTMTGNLTMTGKDINLNTTGSSSDDSGDIAWFYGNGQEKARLWTSNEYSAESGLSYRLYKKDGTSLFSGTIPLRDTKNTAGSTDTSSKIYLIGATSQAANPQTYSDNEVYATSGVLTTKSVQVGGTAATMQYNSTDKCIEFVFA